MIPFNLVDAPSQRFYVAFFYLALLIWRLCDYYGLVSDETDSFRLFMKWVVIDGVVLYGLPGLRIPWLQWSSTTMTMLFALHAIADYVLMFRVPVSVIISTCCSHADHVFRFLSKHGLSLSHGYSITESSPSPSDA